MEYSYPDPEEAAYAPNLPDVLANETNRAFNSYKPQYDQMDVVLSGEEISASESERSTLLVPGRLRQQTRHSERDLLGQISLGPDVSNSSGEELPDDVAAQSMSRRTRRQPYESGQSDKKARGTRRSSGTGREARRGDIGRGGKGIKRGPRDPIEPTPEFKALHSEATMAFITGDLDRAEALTLQAITLNPDMYAAHNLLSEIHMARPDKKKAIIAAWNGAHTRPGDAQIWSRIARLILELDDDDREQWLEAAVYCYSRVITADKTNLEARFQKAALQREIGHTRKSAYEYEQLLKLLPHDTSILRLLAELYILLGEPDKALKHYQKTVSHLQDLTSDDLMGFDWSDVNIIAELHASDKQYKVAVATIKSLSRWLLGRRGEDVWDSFELDDREWDAEHEPRRLQVAESRPGEYDLASYGEGLPLELRVKLGIFRLRENADQVEEALNHFEWLEPSDQEAGAKLFDYPDLFKEAGRSLFDLGLYSEALTFYEPLQRIPEHFDENCRQEAGTCYFALGIHNDLTENLKRSTGFVDTNVNQNNDSSPMDMERANSSGSIMPATAEFESRTPPRRSSSGLLQRPVQASESTKASRAMLTVNAPKRSPRKSMAARSTENLASVEQLLVKRQNLASRLDEKNTNSRDLWIDANQSLIVIFQNQRVFYPSEKSQRFLGYGRDTSHDSSHPMRVSEEPQFDDQEKSQYSDIPDNFCGIGFRLWLEIFLVHALELARKGRLEEAYSTVISARDANVFYQSRQALFLIHVCWFSCALMGSDDESLCNVSRWFMKEYQFVTDAYRLFATLNRLTTSDHSSYHGGPSQKFLLRQIKAMDFSLLGHGRDQRINQEKTPYTTRDDDGNRIYAADLDVALLMLYGHILYAGKSYAYAVNYFLRAFALDPENAVIKLSLGLGYIHHAFRRQADNRHQLLTQGIALLLEYHEDRKQVGNKSEQQESWYNLGRAYHLVGLSHLAVPYYEKCLELGLNMKNIDDMQGGQDFSVEAALALQGIWAASGDMQRAEAVTRRWLEL